jgi:hypothetical protein
MIHCRPKKSTYLILGIVLIILLIGLIFLLNDFSNKRTYGLLFYLFGASFLTLTILILIVKMMAGYKFISVGRDEIVVRLPLKGFTKSYTFAQVIVWEEETVIANKRDFRQLTLVFTDKWSISISNHEHVNYQEFIGFINKKIPNKKSPKKTQ